MKSFEERYANLLRGGEDNTPLATDGYKFSMAQAGFPLRKESFYLHYRKGGPQFLPFDFEDVIQELKPRLPNGREAGYLLTYGYEMTPAMDVALQGDLDVLAQDHWSWANENEPIALVSGPSFLVSWMEAMSIAFQFPIQIATAMKNGTHKFQATCEAEANIIRLVAEAFALYDGYDVDPEIHVCEEEYRIGIRDHLARLDVALDGDIHRAFEVGARSMSCMDQHRIVLEECRAAGILGTTNMKLAYDIYMTPVGTTGHEHQERHGADINGFRAIRDMRPESPSYLFDTYHPMKSGIPAAIKTMREDRTRPCSVRFDSGDQPAQLRKFVAAQKEFGLDITYLFMDGYDNQRVAKMERLCDTLGVPKETRHYGLGGYLVSGPAPTKYTRDHLAMVYKLCKTGDRAVRKYSGTPGKESLSGQPILVVTQEGQRYICQVGEGFVPPDEIQNPRILHQIPANPSTLSPATKMLNSTCRIRDFKEPECP